MRRSHRRSAADSKGWTRWTRAAVAALAVLSTAFPVGQAFAEKPTGARKLEREIGIMERTIDHMLIESPNLLVSGHDATEGVYLDEFGVVFSFDVSLVSRGWGFNWWNDRHVRVEDDGDKIVIFKDGNRWNRDDDDDDGRQADDEKGDKDEDKKSWWEKSKSRSEKLYARGKVELTGVLVDYGDMLTSLRDDQWVALAANLSGDEYFLDGGLSQYLIKVRMSDLRAHTNGALARDALVKRIVINEH